MKCITTIITRTIATAVLRHSWAVQSAAERRQAQGERLEGWAHRVAVRWGCVDDMLHTVTVETLSNR